MKKIFLGLTFILQLYGIVCNAQATLTNYHFCDPPGTILHDAPATFNGNVGNWQRSHGTPNWGTSYVTMWHRIGEDGGEGIFQNNAFPVFTMHYRIRIGVSINRGKLMVYAAPSGSILPFTGFPLSGGSGIPTPVGAVKIGELNGPFTGEWEVHSHFQNPFPIGTGAIFIYPQMLGLGTSVATLDYVTVCPVPDPLATYHTGTIPTGLTNTVFINIGSDFGGSGVVNNNPNANTELMADRAVTMLPNTLLAANSGYNLLAHIASFFTCENPEDGCGGVPPSIPPGEGEDEGEGEGILGSDGNEKKYLGTSSIAANNGIKIFPNPTAGAFTIQFPGIGSYIVNVTNQLGGVIYKAQFKDRRTAEIKLDDILRSGTYTVHITGENINHIQKVTITK